MDEIFHFISKIIIVIPITALVGTLFMRAGGNAPPTGTISSPTSSPAYRQTTTTPSVSFENLNLTGPFVCNYENTEVNLNAHVQDKKISFTIAQTAETASKMRNFLYRDDCLYMWDTGSFSGEKICGLGRYVQVADTLLSTKLLSFNSLLGELTRFGNIATLIGSNENLTYLADSCKKSEIENEVIFTLPKSVLFKNKELKDASLK